MNADTHKPVCSHCGERDGATAALDALERQWLEPVEVPLDELIQEIVSTNQSPKKCDNIAVAHANQVDWKKLGTATL